jgi:hypothetical protein
MQQHLDLIPHAVQGGIIYQRPKDGYINATAMCQAAGKDWFDYRRLKTTVAFIEALVIETGIPGSVLVQSLKGGDTRIQGTWVHPQVAIHLGQWVSAKFAVQVSQWVFDWMSGNIPASVAVPYHLRRYVANQPNVPVGHFSILTEMTQLLIAPMELMGYTLPEHMFPDISHGKMFCKWLRDLTGSTPPLCRPTCMSMRMVGGFGRKPIRITCCRIFGSTFERNGCRTGRSTISGHGTAKPSHISPR